MSTTLAISQLRAGFGWDYETVQSYGNSVQNNSVSFSSSFANGSGAGQASKIFIVKDTVGITASGTVTYDLTNLTDPFGTSLSYAGVKVLYLMNTSANASGIDIKVGPGATNGWAAAAGMWNGTSNVTLVKANAMILHVSQDAAGWAGIDGTHKTIDLTNLSGSSAAPYQLVIVGI